MNNDLNKKFTNQTLRGMRDFTGQNAILLKFIENLLISTMKNFGYSFVELPLLERTEVFLRSIGEETDIVGKEMYTFLDKSGESVTMRPEGTASAVRALIEGGFEQTLPQKWMYFGPMFRHERPQRGRFREFFQFGCEFFGSDNFTSDVECIVAANEILDALEIKNRKLFINTIGDQSDRNNFKIELIKYFSGVVNQLSEDSKRRLNKNPLRILDSKEEADIFICKNAPKLSNFLKEASKSFFKNFCDLLDSLKISYEIDENLVRGLDYYTHTVFEVKAAFSEDKKGMEKEKLIAICGGGRYDGLIKLMGGNDIPAVGFAFGVDRLIEIISSKIFPKMNSIGIITISEEENNEAFNIAEKIRKTLNMMTFITSEKTIAKKIKSCVKKGIDVAIILGGEEIKNNILKIKFLNDFKLHKSGSEIEIPSFELINCLRDLFFS